MTFVNAIFLLSLIVWIGGIIFFSFIGAPSIFKSLPPDYAGKVVGVIFPKYYPMGYLSGLVAFVCLLISGFKTGAWSAFKLALLAVMIFLTVSNSLVTHPKARALKEEMKTASSQTELVQLKEVFDRIHRWSVVNNAIVLFLGLILVFLTARNLQI